MLKKHEETNITKDKAKFPFCSSQETHFSCSFTGKVDILTEVDPLLMPSGSGVVVLGNDDIFQIPTRIELTNNRLLPLKRPMGSHER